MTLLESPEPASLEHTAQLRQNISCLDRRWRVLVFPRCSPHTHSPLEVINLQEGLKKQTEITLSKTLPHPTPTHITHSYTRTQHMSKCNGSIVWLRSQTQKICDSANKLTFALSWCSENTSIEPSDHGLTSLELEQHQSPFLKPFLC